MSISWPELIVLMGFGPAVALDGVVQVREVNPLDDDTTDEDVDGRVEQHPTLGRVAVHEHEFRVRWHGDRQRVESVSGRVRMIFGAKTVWLFEGDDPVPVAHDASRSSIGWSGSDFARRLPPSRWEGTDFTQLTGPIEATTFLGRDAWAFELAPPAHKPHPLQLIVDAETGIVLRQGNRDFGSFAQWTSLDLHADLPDELFDWHGEYVTVSFRYRERDEEHARDMAERFAWLDAHGVALDLAVQPDILLHERSDETGAFHASFDLSVHGLLLRRPTSSDPWPDADGVRYDHLHRWSDPRWDWLLATVDRLADDQLAAVRARLATST